MSRRWLVRSGVGVVIAGLVALVPMADAWACLPLASLHANPAQVQPGGQVTVTGSEFGSNPVQIHFNALTGPVLATLNPTQTWPRQISGTVTIPNVAPGDYVLVATETATTPHGPFGSSAGVPARAVVEVVGPGGAPLAPPMSNLTVRPTGLQASSGLSLATLALIGLGAFGVALFLAGAVALVSAGRREPVAAPVRES